MAATIRKTRNGRHILTMDGCSDYYGGATVHGAIVCRISLPPEAKPIRDAHGVLWFTDPQFPGTYSRPAEIAAAARRGDIPGARVYGFRYIQ